MTSEQFELLYQLLDKIRLEVVLLESIIGFIGGGIMFALYHIWRKR